MTNKLFVAGLPYSLTDAQLEEHFSKIGKVLSAKVIVDKYSGQSKGFGFVEMETSEDAIKAMKELDNSLLGGRNIVVKEAKPQEDRNDRSGNRSNNDKNSYSRKNRW